MLRHTLAALLIALPCFAHAVQVCELDGQHVNPANGSTTAGKTGLMRCRDGEGGPVLREQELRNGVFMGIVRYYKNGVLEKEYSVNERGNRDGRSREFAATPGTENRVLREETARNGTTIGLVRSWYPNGTLRRTSFHGDDGRERAEAEFTPQGQLADLRCGPTPMLAPAADDAAWCGHAGTLASVDLYAANGQLRGRLAHERGERRRSETFWDNGKAREVAEIGREGGSERSFTPEGQPRREQQWVAVPATPAGSEARSRRTTVLDREFSDAGTVVRERRWQPAERGALLVSDKTWYLNGQPREVQAFTAEGNLTLQSEADYHDNGKPSFQGQWKLSGRYERLAVGVHKRFDEQGRLRSERHHDDKGRVQREREFDESGGLVRDDEVYADGSRKAFSR